MKETEKLPPVNIRSLRVFDIEVSRHCNLVCEFCPREAFKNQGFMTPDTFANFLKNTPMRTGDLVVFCGLGESLLNPSFAHCLSALKNQYPLVKTQLITNGTLLTAKTVTMLLDSGINFIIVSFNGTEAATYERLMKGANFTQSMANIENALAEIQKRKDTTAQLMVTYILSNENFKEEEAIKAFWQAKGIRTIPQYMHNRGGFANSDSMSPITGSEPPERPCIYFQVYTFIAWNGDVLLCCNDIQHLHLLGNINNDSMTLIESRKEHYITQNNWPDLCNTCTAPPK